jgi:protein PhnA
VEGDAALDATHLFCLQEAIWSEVPAVVVVSWRLLSRLSGEVWAQDLLDQVYLEEEVLQWAEQGMADEKESSEEHVRTFDSNGAELFEGDSVTLIKDLDVKGTAFVAKRGTLVKGIRLTGDPDNIEGRVNKISIVLKTCFLKKAN